VEVNKEVARRKKVTEDKEEEDKRRRFVNTLNLKRHVTT
jgi:hypothetical protein